MINAAMVLVMLEGELIVRTVALGVVIIAVMKHDESEEGEFAFFGLMLLIMPEELREMNPIVAPCEIQCHEGDQEPVGEGFHVAKVWFFKPMHMCT